MTTTPPAPTVTASADASPCPRVEIDITPMPDDAATITVWRSWAGHRAPVRGAKNATATGDFLVVDYEVPLGITVTYTCQTTDDSGSPSNLSDPSETVLLDLAEMWLQDPLDPTSAIEVVPGPPSDATIALEAAAFGKFTFAAGDQTVTQVVGSASPVGYAGPRQDASGMPLTFASFDGPAAAALLALFRQAYPLCVRTPVKIPFLDGLMYASVGDIDADPYAMADVVVWSMTAQAVQPPGASVLIPVRTWNDVLAEAATWNDLLTLYPTWNDLLRGTT